MVRRYLLAFLVASACASSIVILPVSSASGAAPSASSLPKGTWPGVGTVCEAGPGGGAAARGLTAKSIDIATFADPGNTVEPGLNQEFFQLASAFAKWCNAAGGIDGRKIVVHDRDGAFFNGGQVTEESCQQDFMAVGGGLVLDQSAVPTRVGCGLAQIPSYLVSDAADDAPLQVNPQGIRVDEIEAGWYGALARKYPQAVQHAGTGAENTPSILEPTEKWEQAAEQQGWKFVDFEEPSLTTVDWAPFVARAQSKGVEALEPPTAAGETYFQELSTAGYKPTFMIMPLGIVPDAAAGSPSAVAGLNTSGLAPTYFPVQTWPYELASQSPGLEQLIALLHTYAKGDPIDTNDEWALDAWLLFAKSASACGPSLTTTCVLQHAASQQNWTGGGVYAPIAHLAMSNDQPTPSDCYALMKIVGTKFVYDKTDTKPNNQIWHCDPKSIYKVSVPG